MNALGIFNSLRIPQKFVFACSEQLVSEKGEQVHAQGRSRSEDTSKRNSSKRIVRSEQVDELLADGWEPTMTLPDGRVVMIAT